MSADEFLRFQTGSSYALYNAKGTNETIKDNSVYLILDWKKLGILVYTVFYLNLRIYYMNKAGFFTTSLLVPKKIVHMVPL